MRLTMSVSVPLPHCSALCTHAFCSCHTHFCTSSSHAKTLKQHPALPTLQILTDGDVEAVNTEGGTPTLPKSMLLGVSFHRFGTLRSPLRLLIFF